MSGTRIAEMNGFKEKIEARNLIKLSEPSLLLWFQKKQIHTNMSNRKALRSQLIENMREC